MPRRGRPPYAITLAEVQTVIDELSHHELAPRVRERLLMVAARGLGADALHGRSTFGCGVFVKREYTPSRMDHGVGDPDVQRRPTWLRSISLHSGRRKSSV
jgi:hypothetical protein